MVYTGSFGGVSNQEDWEVTISLFADADGSPFSVAGAQILTRVCREGNSHHALVGAQTDDGSITISDDGNSFSWKVPASAMGQLSPDVYNVFVRLILNGSPKQLVSATLTVIDGGPSQ